jgi:hypothetical protein
MGAITPIYQPGQALTGRVTDAPVVGGRFVMQSATKANGEPLKVKYPTGTTVELAGVTHGDAAVGEDVPLLRAGIWAPVEVGSGGVTFGTAVMVDTSGRVVAHTGTNIKAGIARETKSAAEFALVEIL